MKIDIYRVSIGTIKAIRLTDGAGYACAFNDESTLVEPLDATLVIN
jgi:hypothetical protein